MKKKIFRSICLTSLLAALLTAALIFGVLYLQFFTQIKLEVAKQTAYIQTAVELYGEDYLNRLLARDDVERITLIAADGTVLFDNQADPAAMGNHLDRPEVRQALAQGYGEETRVSSTLGEQTFYHAVLLADGQILRVAATTHSAWAAALACLPYLLTALIIVILLSLVFARVRTRDIIAPINGLNLDEPLSNEMYDELSPLLLRIERQRREIAYREGELKKRREEFTAITENMNEGLIVLDRRGAVLSINNSASRLFGVEGLRYIGRDILTVDRSLAIGQLADKALAGEFAAAELTLRSGRYQLIASPVKPAGGRPADGAVLLILDISARAAAEQMRREFTANVSHELRTPLQTISGAAELIKNGLVAPGDLPRFIEQIYGETQRLIRLVGDIIRLSALDEQAGGLPREPVALLALARDTAAALAPLAEQYQVDLDATGEDAVIAAAPQLVSEIIYNLCDNAIRYNRPGGKVTISVSATDQEAVLAVSDTGVGIGPEHQGRIFERFYRVDKSHSRETGGTGLGLSIVKHAAELHRAKIELTSAAGRGTTVRVRFPQ